MKETKASASVLTLGRGRADHLCNVIRGLAAQIVLPAELVSGVMQDAPYADLPATPFPIRQVQVTAPALPFAAVRKPVAQAAIKKILIFLDIDCIPAPSLVEDCCRETRAGEGMTMGKVLHLPAGVAAPGWTVAQFDVVGVRHSDRQGLPEEARRRCEDCRCFWSLNFALHRTDWECSGGFDERFTGYGGEDTDFGRILHEKPIPIWWIRGAQIYHHHHPHCMPPVHHVRSILRNTEIFASKWGHPTMKHWLHAFCLLGLIQNTRSGLRMVREPDSADFRLCEQTSDMPYAAPGRVIGVLEDRARRAAGLPEEDASSPARQAAMTAAQNELLVPGGGLARPMAAEWCGSRCSPICATRSLRSSRGIKAHSWLLARELAARGHDVTLFASGDSRAHLPDGVALHAVAERHCDVDYPWRIFHGMEALSTWQDTVFARVCDHLRTAEFNVIHNNTLHRFPPQAAFAKGLPMVTSLHVPPFEGLRRTVRTGASRWSRLTATSK